MGRSVRPGWYLRVAPRIHNVWDNNKRCAIVVLREEGSTPDLLARAFGTTKTIIYNQTRLGRCALRKVCYQCRRPLKIKRRTGKPQLCPTCKRENRNYKKELREKAYTFNLCLACMKNKPMKGHTYCRKCISATYRRRIRKGLCGTCGKKPIEKKRSMSQCKKCLDKNKK